RTRPAETGFDWLKLESNWPRPVPIAFDRLKPNKPAETGFDRLKPE
ncbi:hypothetical protein CP02DC14_2321, partial [Chlamydia psittaci 02DC14]